MEQLLYFIMFVVYVGYSIYQSLQKEGGGDKKIVEDWENQPLEGEKSIEELLAEYLDPKKETAAQAPKEEPVALPVDSSEEDDSEGGRSLAQRMREMPQSNSRKERERKKLEIDGDDTLHQEDEEEEEEIILSPREEFRQRQERERQAEAAKNTMSATEEYEMLAAERRRERESLHTSVEREKVNIRNQKQLNEINEIYSKKRLRKKGNFKFNARDAIVYQIIMKRKYGR